MTRRELRKLTRALEAMAAALDRLPRSYAFGGGIEIHHTGFPSPYQPAPMYNPQSWYNTAQQ